MKTEACSENKFLFDIIFTFVDGLLNHAGVKHAGNCYMVSEILQDYLATYWLVDSDLINAKVKQGSESINHYYLQMNNGEIIDATASQFIDMPKVYIGKIPSNYCPIKKIQPQRKHF